MVEAPHGRSTPRAELAQIDHDVALEARQILREEIRVPAVPTTNRRRCRICIRPDSLKLVDRLLSYGMGAQEVLEMCGPINEKRPKNLRITYGSVHNHKNHHFTVTQPTKAAYRRILERQRADHAQDVADNAASELTVWGYLDVIAHKGYQNLIRNGTQISPALGMEAILRLHELTRKGGTEAELLDMRRQVSLLQQAVREVVPETMWAEIASRIDEIVVRQERSVLDAEVLTDDDDEDDDYDDEPFDPVIDTDTEDELE